MAAIVAKAIKQSLAILALSLPCLLGWHNNKLNNIDPNCRVTQGGNASIAFWYF